MLLLPGPGLTVDLGKQIKSVEAKVHGAAGRVQQLEGARVAQLGGGLWRFVRLDQQILAPLAQAGGPARGVEPETPEGVVLLAALRDLGGWRIASDSAKVEDWVKATREQNPRVLQAKDGQRALQILRSEPVQVVLADIDMPVHNGLEVLEAMRAEPRLASLPRNVRWCRGAKEPGWCKRAM